MSERKTWRVTDQLPHVGDEVEIRRGDGWEPVRVASVQAISLGSVRRHMTVLDVQGKERRISGTATWRYSDERTSPDEGLL